MRLTKSQVLFVVVCMLAFVAGMLCHRHLPLAQQPGEEQATVETNQLEVPRVAQNDWSVIVHDKGASFKMAPASNKQPPVVVTEQEVRGRSNSTVGTVPQK